MSAVRHLLAQRRLAALILTAALLMKLLVPAGFMIGGHDGTITIEVCSGTAPRTMTIAVPGMGDQTPDHDKADHGKAEMPCAFAGLSAAALGSIDPIQLAALIAFVLAIGLARAPLPAPTRTRHLRPPLRGPPASL